MMEEKLFRYIAKVGADKLRLTELIAHFTHDVPGSEKENLIFPDIKLDLQPGNLQATLAGVPPGSVLREVKAVTFNDLKIRRVGCGVRVLIVFDL